MKLKEYADYAIRFKLASSQVESVFSSKKITQVKHL